MLTHDTYYCSISLEVYWRLYFEGIVLSIEDLKDGKTFYTEVNLSSRWASTAIQVFPFLK
jgi:hypothetical protein